MEAMRRTLALAAVWLVAAAIALTVAWQGVSVVGDQVTDDRPAPLAAAEIENRLEAAAAAGSSTSSTSGAGAATTSPAPSSAPSTAAPTSIAAPDVTTTAPAAPAGETRTYNVRGGTATLRFLPSGVEVVFANPGAGFNVEIEPEHGNGVKVEFESDSHESRIDAWWDGGPVDRVREEPAD